MPEGPSLVIAKEEIQIFKGKIVRVVSGKSKIDQKKLVNKKLLDVKTWGKHLLLCFDSFTIRIHFLMFGKYLINDTKPGIPSLSLGFAKGELNFYTSAVALIEEPLDEVYDWGADVLSDNWDPKSARKKLKKIPKVIVADALLDQTIFSGVGNIIKNEILFRIKLHPKTLVSDVPPRKLGQMISEARNYSFDFLKWKKEFTLKKHWQVYTKKICPRDGDAIIKEYPGKTKRRTFYCESCQLRYR
jgi:endonuclease-8